MATPNPKKTSGDKTEEEIKLEAKLQAMTTEKKTVFDTIREADERVREIREEEGRIQDELHQIKAQKLEKEQRERHETCLKAQEQVASLSNERMSMTEELNVTKRKNSELNESLSKLKVNLQRTTSYSRTLKKEKKEKEEEVLKLTERIKCLEDDIPKAEIQKEEEVEKLTKRIQCLEDEISKAEIQRHCQDEFPFKENAREAELQAELAPLRTENELKTDRTKEMMERMEVSQLRENLRRITNLSKTQQKKIKCLEDEKFAAQQIAVETQLRQLDELASHQTLTDEEIRQLKETLTTMHRQHQQPAAEEHRQGKYLRVCLNRTSMYISL